MAIKAYVEKSKINLAEKLPPVGIKLAPKDSQTSCVTLSCLPN